MSTQREFELNSRLLDIVGYLTWAAIAVPSIWINFSQNHPDRWTITALILAFGLLLLFSHNIVLSHPLSGYVYMGLQTFITGSLFVLGPISLLYVVLLFILSAQAMSVLPQRVGWMWLVVFVIITAAALYRDQSVQDMMLSLPIYIGGYYFFAAFANETMRADRARRESQRLLEEVQIAHARLQAYAATAEALAVAEERNRLAREMHDTLGHRLTVAAVQLEGALRLIPEDPERAREIVGTVRGQVREALGELRSTVATLRTPLEADIPLDQALTHLVQSFEEATGVRVHLSLHEQMPALEPSHRLAMYRGAQEGLTNIHKHAQADEAWVRLALEDGAVVLEVVDNGRGHATEARTFSAAQGFGLRGLWERALHLGGELTLEPREGGGTRLEMKLPLKGNAVGARSND